MRIKSFINNNDNNIYSFFSFSISSLSCKHSKYWVNTIILGMGILLNIYYI
jgi:hypothetical protein